MTVDSAINNGPCMADSSAFPKADAPRVLVRGVANAGKTRAACGHVRDLLAAGVPACDILFLAATPTAARDIACELEDAAEGVCITTAREFELGILSEPAAHAFVGRRPRVLCDFEESFLLEDLRATGIPARRLKGMLGFFRKSLTELADDDMASFIIDVREQTVLDALHAHLSAYDAVLDCEVSNLTVHYLREHPEAGAATGVRHIVVDDYQCLNRASQIALELLAPQTLWAFADETLAAQGSDPFPYLAGVAEFCERNPEAPQVELAAPETGAASAAAWLAKGGYLSALSLGLAEDRGKVASEHAYDVVPAAPAVAGVCQRVYATPDDELDGVASQVTSLVHAGADPSDILVLAPNRAWAGNVERRLAQAGVAVEAHEGARLAGGSFRDLARCQTGRMFTALALLADPNDSLAWRCWCGVGDYLARSNIFTGIEALAHERACGLGEAMALLEAGEAPEVPGQAGALEAYRQGREMIANLSSLHGAELLGALAKGLGMDGVPKLFAALASDALAGPDADAKALFAAAQRFMQQGQVCPGAVRVALYDQACALKAGHVVVCGLMNGWLPEHSYFDLAEADFDARAKIDAETRQKMYELASCATGELVLTGFADCDLELAERMHLKGYKVRMGEDGKRTTTVRPSDLATYALHAWGLAPLPAKSLLRDYAPAQVNA